MADKVCPTCGYQLQPFDKECPKCARIAEQGEQPQGQPTQAQPPPGQMPPQPAAPLGAPQPLVVPAEKVGFWTRFLAALIDGIVLAIISTVLGFALVSAGAARTANALGSLVGLAYSVLLIGGTGQTVGMMALSIRVIRTDGTKVDYLIAFIRWIGSILSALGLLLGYLWIAFDPDKQAWHDKIAGTYVVRT